MLKQVMIKKLYDCFLAMSLEMQSAHFLIPLHKVTLSLL